MTEVRPITQAFVDMTITALQETGEADLALPIICRLPEVVAALAEIQAAFSEPLLVEELGNRSVHLVVSE